MLCVNEQPTFGDIGIRFWNKWKQDSFQKDPEKNPIPNGRLKIKWIFWNVLHWKCNKQTKYNSFGFVKIFKLTNES